MSSQNMVVQNGRRQNLVFESLQDWPGTGRADLHRAGNTGGLSRPVRYWSIKANVGEETVCVGEIFRDDVKTQIDTAIECLEVLQSLGMPTNPEELRLRLTQ